MKDHWMCRNFSDPEGDGVQRRLLPVVKPQPGRLIFRCLTVIHVRSKSDMEAGKYNVKLTTLYDSNQRQSYISSLGRYVFEKFMDHEFPKIVGH